MMRGTRLIEALRAQMFWLASRIAGRRSFRGRDRLTAALLRLAQAVGEPVTVEIDGLSLRLDLDDGLCRALWLTRTLPQSGEALRRLCEPGDVVVDVGANVGYMALIAARAVGDRGRVVAIEPSRRAFALLECNSARNLPGRVVPVRAACTERDGTATMFVSDYSGEYSSLIAAAVPGAAHPETVPARALRSLGAEYGIVPDVVKIDVEGAEWPVLRGLLGRGDACPRALVVEAYATNTRHFGYAPSAMCRWLAGMGYQLALDSGSGPLEYSDELVDGPALHDLVATRPRDV